MKMILCSALVLTAGVAHAREWKCKAVALEGETVIAEATTEKLSECLAALKERVKVAKCGAGADKVEFLTQSEVLGKWTKGTRLTVKCK